jgi:hypothetical protein
VTRIKLAVAMALLFVLLISTARAVALTPNTTGCVKAKDLVVITSGTVELYVGEVRAFGVIQPTLVTQTGPNAREGFPWNGPHSSDEGVLGTVSFCAGYESGPSSLSVYTKAFRALRPGRVVVTAPQAPTFGTKPPVDLGPPGFEVVVSIRGCAFTLPYVCLHGR